MKCVRTVALFAATLGLLASTAAANRFDQYTKKWKTPANPVKIEMATLLGGTGTEWVADADFLPDGTVVVVGTSLGGELKLGPVGPKTMGRDTVVDPQAPEAVKGLGWKHANRTGFIAWIDTTGGKVVRAIRLPWTAGSLNAVEVGPDGNIYVSGAVGDAFDALGSARTISGDRDQGEIDGFVMKLTPAGEKQWLLRFDDAYKGIKLRRRPDGNMVVIAHWGYVIDSSGKVVESRELRKTKNWYRAVSPKDFTQAIGYDRNTHTGREPWRQPTLSILKPDGELRFDLYQWGPKLVGSDKYRLVSDSSFSKNAIRFTSDGTLYAVGWSDGGNTVLERQPRDLDAKLDVPGGLGFSSWGAGALSLSHIIKLNPGTGKVLNKMLWCSFVPTKNKPNSARIGVLHQVSNDGAIAFAGSSASGLIQTGDNLFGEGTPGGPYVTILDDHMADMRFSSILPACGEVKFYEHPGTDERWGMGVRTVGGRRKLAVVCGAVEEKGYYTDPKPAPTTDDAVQPGYGGGATDGYLIVFDLGVE